jgi:hypothetical protein
MFLKREARFAEVLKKERILKKTILAQNKTAIGQW